MTDTERRDWRAKFNQVGDSPAYYSLGIYIKKDWVEELLAHCEGLEQKYEHAQKEGQEYKNINQDLNNEYIKRGERIKELEKELEAHKKILEEFIGWCIDAVLTSYSIEKKMDKLKDKHLPKGGE